MSTTTAQPAIGFIGLLDLHGSKTKRIRAPARPVPTHNQR
jgi:hypothetical protein